MGNGGNMIPAGNAPKPEHELLEMREDSPAKKSAFSNRVLKEIRGWAIELVIALLLFFLVRTFLFTLIRVEGSSMQNTLHTGDRIIATILDMKINGAHRGDVVICHYPNRKDQFVKRVVGVAGDEIEIRDNVTYINGETQSEPYVTHLSGEDFGPYTVPEGHYFVMGDNRGNSNDSRYPDVGPLAEDMLIGIARVIIWPFSDIGAVTKVS